MPPHYLPRAPAFCAGTLFTQPETEPAGLLEFLWYRPSHRLWLRCPSRVVCVVRARCESRTYKTPPHVWAQHEGRTHGCWQLSCQQDPTREPRLCARRSDDQRVLVDTVAWPLWVATSLSPGHVEVGVDRSAVPVVHSGLALFLRGRLLAYTTGTEGQLALSRMGLQPLGTPGWRITVPQFRCPLGAPAEEKGMRYATRSTDHPSFPALRSVNPAMLRGAECYCRGLY